MRASRSGLLWASRSSGDLLWPPLGSIGSNGKPFSVLWRTGGRAVWALPLGFMAALAVGGALGMTGAPIPLVEQGILGSLVTIGLAVALAWCVQTAAGLALVSAFALLDGYAHGAAMPESASALCYAFGFLMATGLLHAAGLAARRVGQARLTRGMGVAISAAGMVLMLG